MSVRYEGHEATAAIGLLIMAVCFAGMCSVALGIIGLYAGWSVR